jgi:hypothetical protein
MAWAGPKNRTKVPKATPPPIANAAELQTYSAEHLVYELQMLFGAVRAATNDPWSFATQSNDLTTTNGPVLQSAWVGMEPWFQKNSRIEAFATHLRNLITFLFPDEYPLKPDDVAAHHFISAPDPLQAWLAARPALSVSLRDAKVRADKELAHLTTRRIAGAPDQKAWPIAALATELASILKIFVTAADPSRLAPEVVTELKRLTLDNAI